MPFYIYSCEECNYVEDVLCSMSERKATIPCKKCGKEMERNYTLEQHGGNLAALNEEHPRYSASGGVLEEDLAAARQLHPHITEWKKFGNSYRPLIRNRADKLKFMKQAGAYEY